MITQEIYNSFNKFKGYYIPLFKISPANTPYHAGTAFGLEHDGSLYLVTAKHVLDKDEDNPSDEKNQLFFHVNGLLTQLKIFTQLVFFDTGNENTRKEIDIVFIQSKLIDLRTVFSGFFSSNTIFQDNLQSSHYLGACGFPQTKNSSKNDIRITTNRPYGYFGKISIKLKTRKLGYNTKNHFCIDILLKKVYTNKQKEIKAPRPHGISGGPVLVAYNFSSPTRKFTPILRGVAIESKLKQNCFVCVDLLPIINQLRSGI